MHAAAFGCDLVLLDARTGEYDLMASAASVVELSADRRTLTFLDDADIAALATSGLFSAASQTNASRAAVAPCRSALGEGDGPVGAVDGARMALGWLRMLGRYYGRSFPALIARERPDASRRESDGEGEARLLHRARAFDRLSPWTPFAGDCLFRCAMLLQLLGADAAATDWVFGVRTGPFLAHCWLQSGDLVLTDAADAVTLFSPILVV